MVEIIEPPAAAAARALTAPPRLSCSGTTSAAEAARAGARLAARRFACGRVRLPFR